MPRDSDRDTHAQLAQQVEDQRSETRRLAPGRRRSDVEEPSWFWFIYAIGIVSGLLLSWAAQRYGWSWVGLFT